MILPEKRRTIIWTALKAAMFLTVFLLASFSANGQEPPPRPVTITPTAQGLSFGAFSQGAIGGTVTIAADGSRTSTGDIILLNLTGFTFTTALFEVVGNPGTVVSILNGPDVSLTGSSGGSMLLQVGASSPASPFVITTTPPAFITLNIGGSLTVGNPALNPPGNYTGTFNITLVQE